MKKLYRFPVVNYYEDDITEYYKLTPDEQRELTNQPEGLEKDMYISQDVMDNIERIESDQNLFEHANRASDFSETTLILNTGVELKISMPIEDVLEILSKGGMFKVEENE